MCSTIRLVIITYFLGVCNGAIKACEFSSQDLIRSNYSSEIKNYMCSLDHACENFYEYACGNFDVFQSLPEGQDDMNAFIRLELGEREVWRKLLQDPENVTDHGETFLKAKNFYQSCININEIEQRGITPLIEYLKTFGGWPAIDINWTGNGINWHKFHANIEWFSEGLVKMGMKNDLFNGSRYSLHVLYPNMNLKYRRYYKEGSKKFTAYQTYLRDSLKAFNVPEERIEAEFNDILDFELKMSNIVLDFKDYSYDIKGYKATTIGELENNYKSFGWEEYFKLFLADPEIDLSEKVIIHGNFLENLDTLLKNTTKRTIFNYLGWQASKQLMLHLGSKFLEITHKLKSALTGESMKPRLDTCVIQTQKYFEAALATSYAKRTFDEQKRENINDLYSRLKNSLEQAIEEADWMDSKSKTNLKLKLKNVELQVGYPDLILNTTRTNKLYENITMKSDDYFGNMVQLLTFWIYTGWSASFSIPAATYSVNTVDVLIAASLLQLPLYHKHLPNFVNFAKIGSLIAHEISHAFDTNQIYFDREGEANNMLSNASLATYREKEKCFVEKYGNYSYNGVKLDGKLVLGETVADDMGIKAAFSAYKKWFEEKKNSPEIKNENLIGFSASKEKMFFLSFAQLYCDYISDNIFPDLFETEVHSLEKYRINGVLSNLKEFSDAYSCPVGSEMHSAKKCAIW